MVCPPAPPPLQSRARAKHIISRVFKAIPRKQQHGSKEVGGSMAAGCRCPAAARTLQLHSPRRVLLMRGQRQSASNPSFPYLLNAHISIMQACTAVAFRTFAMREGLRRALSATPLRQSIAEWPSWTPEVLTYIALFGQGLSHPEPGRMDSASCSRVSAVLMHKDALAASAAAEGVSAGDCRASVPKSALHWHSRRIVHFVCHSRRSVAVFCGIKLTC
jgi:hypothetical protein